MFHKGWKTKSNEIEFEHNHIGYFTERFKCIKCGKPIKWGDFAYDQNMCWKCFEEQVVRIAKSAQTIEDTKIVLHLLKIIEESIGGNKNEQE